MIEPAPPHERVAIANRADGGLIYWLAKLYGFAALFAFVLLMLASSITLQLLLDPHAADA